MNRKLYTLLLYLLAPVIGIYFLYRGLKDSRYFHGLKQRLGLLPKAINSHGIHIHCASVGETRSALPLIKRIIQKYPNLSILITTTTPTGKDEAQKFIKSFESNELTHFNAVNRQITHTYLPIDWPGACKRFVKKLNPQLSILIETELWPNLLNQLHKQKVPILLANARLSSSSLKKYQKYPILSKEILSKLSMVTAQYESDSQNFQTLGVPKSKIELVGNIKFDIELSSELLKSQQQLKQTWTADRPSWIAASIHPAEFELILNIHKKLLQILPNILLIAVPRHPERFSELKGLCKKQNLTYINRTDHLSPSSEHCVIVGDTMGELPLMCGAADIAFVGGSLIERGGHNPIEPAACGLPVIIGNSYYNFSEVTDIMGQHGALSIVNDELELFEALKTLFSNNQLLANRAHSTSGVFISNRGAIDKIVNFIVYLINLKTQ